MPAASSPAVLESGRFPADRSDFLFDILAKGRFMRDGHRDGRAAARARLEPKGLLFAGMGFSAIGSGLVMDAAPLEVPATLVKHYHLPHHVKSDWHMLAVSYSGETEETLSVARQAKERGVPITSFATGGRLAGLAQANVPQPEGHQPRAAMAQAWFGVLGFLEGSGLVPEVPLERACQAVAEVDDACGPDVAEDRNEAKQLARRLLEPIPLVYTTPAFFAVGNHFRGMLNENAKKIAGVERIPDCNHNDLSGRGGDAENRTRFSVVVLGHAEEHEEIQKRIAFMRERYTSWGIPWHHHVSAPIQDFADHVVEQARAIQFLDYTAFYLAMLRDVDPSDIKEITALKAFLRG